MAESIYLLFGLWTRVGRRKHKFNYIRQVTPICPHGRAHWCHLANTIEPFICSDNAVLYQITFTICFIWAYWNAELLLVYMTLFSEHMMLLEILLTSLILNMFVNCRNQTQLFVYSTDQWVIFWICFNYNNYNRLTIIVPVLAGTQVKSRNILLEQVLLPACCWWQQLQPLD